jgi:hypothetical protein
MATTTTSAELSLINDSEFLEELETELTSGHELHRVSDSRLPHDLYESLDRELPVHADAESFEPPYVDQPAASFQAYDDPIPAPLVDSDPVISMVAAAIVIAACLSIGAATAAYVFQDSLTRVTASRSASR